MPEAVPSTADIIPLLYWMVPIIVLLVLPGAFASLWGPKFLNPGLVGLLFMTEIIFGSISAALFAGEPLDRAWSLEALWRGWRERNARKDANKYIAVVCTVARIAANVCV